MGGDGGQAGCVPHAPAHFCRRRRRQWQLTAADAIAAAAVDLRQRRKCGDDQPGWGERVGGDGGRGGCVPHAPAHVCRRRRRQRQLTAADAFAAVAVTYKTAPQVPRWSTWVGGAGGRGWGTRRLRPSRARPRLLTSAAADTTDRRRRHRRARRRLVRRGLVATNGRTTWKERMGGGLRGGACVGAARAHIGRRRQRPCPLRPACPCRSMSARVSLSAGVPVSVDVGVSRRN